MREGLDGGPREGGGGLEDRTQAAQQDIRTVVICGQTQLASQFSQPKYGLRRPMLVEVEDELSRQQHEGEDATHPFESVDADIFHIQALFLIEAIAMLDSSAQTPIVVNLLGRTIGFGWECS